MHRASHQAWFDSVNVLFGQFKRFKSDYRVIPHVTFSDPEIASVGLAEQEAHARGIAHEVNKYPLHELDRAIIDEHAGELIAECVFAMKHRLGLNKMLGTIHAYPTLVEANKFAVGMWKKKHAPRRPVALGWPIS